MENALLSKSMRAYWAMIARDDGFTSYERKFANDMGFRCGNNNNLTNKQNNFAVKVLKKALENEYSLPKSVKEYIRYYEQNKILDVMEEHEKNEVVGTDIENKTDQIVVKEKESKGMSLLDRIIAIFK